MLGNGQTSLAALEKMTRVWCHASPSLCWEGGERAFGAADPWCAQEDRTVVYTVSTDTFLYGSVPCTWEGRGYFNLEA